MSKHNKITEEEKRLLAIFSDLDENELQVAKGLIHQAAFMYATLEDLQSAITENGSIGEYKNGKDQYGTKQSAELQAYNQTLRSYNAVMGKLLKIVPHESHTTSTVEEITKRFERDKKAMTSTPEELEQWHKEFCETLKADRERRCLNE